MTGRRVAWVGGGATATLVVLVASLAGGPRSSSSRGSGTEVEVQEAVRRTITTRVKASGEIVPEKKVDISARVVGVIEVINKLTGQEFSQADADLLMVLANVCAAAIERMESEEA